MSSSFGTHSPSGGYLQGRQVAELPARLPQAIRGSRRRITIFGEDILHRPVAEVTEFGSPQLKTIINDMFATMEIAQGVGLAANQVDVDQRIFVFDCHDASDVRHVGHICNPVVDEEFGALQEEDVDTEGCLSIPGPHAEVTRTWKARVTGQDWKGNPIEYTGEGLFGRCLLHETDHVNGIVFVDHLSDAEKARVVREMEAMKEGVWEQWDARAAKLGK